MYPIQNSLPEQIRGQSIELLNRRTGRPTQEPTVPPGEDIASRNMAPTRRAIAIWVNEGGAGGEVR